MAIVPRRVSISFNAEPIFTYPIKRTDAFENENNYKSEDRNPVDNISYCELAFQE